MSGGGYAYGDLIISGPTAHWWTVYVGIGLDGGDNPQYVNFQFVLGDFNSGVIEGTWGLDTYNWITQSTPETQWGTMTAYIVNDVLVEYIIDVAIHLSGHGMPDSSRP